MPIVRVIVCEDGKLCSNPHFGQRTREEADDLRETINAKLREYQRRNPS
jgi:hypothetical protein